LNKTPEAGTSGAEAGFTIGTMFGRNMDNQATEIEKMVPEAKIERDGEGIVVEFKSNDLFDADATSLLGDAKTNLDKLVTILKSYAYTDIQVEGNSDNDGSDAYDGALSQRRAVAVSAYLTSNRIADSRVRIKGMSKSVPRYIDIADDGRSQNRRIQLLITANRKMRTETEKEAAK
jgi:outer membrane protein OmpA-like peptidoglycan-associated protein